MSISYDLLVSYKTPRRIIARKLAEGPREDRALALVMGSCALLFVARFPIDARLAAEFPEIPLDARLTGGLFSLLFIAPLFFYLLAGFSGLLLRVFGGPKSFYGPRLALFWALLCTAPLMMLQGILSGFIGSGVITSAFGLVVFIAFLYIWLMGLIEVMAEQ
ncbi:MAG: YIP1 family protein [Paracoccaceae bacterium]|jgi:hypothetical protein